jgi:hypothetical protein
MPYSLDAGIVGSMVAVVAVDDDGTTIKDFVSGNTIALDTGVSASVATGTWKSITSPKYFVTTANGTFDFNGVRWNGTIPTVDQTDADGMSAGFCCHGADNCSSATAAGFIEISNTFGNQQGLQRISSSTLTGRYIAGGGTVANTATNLPTDGTTKFSFSANYESASDSEVFYGLESGSLASDGTAGSDGGFGGTLGVRAIGGHSGQVNQPFKPYIVWVANRKLTLTEHQSIHNDWRLFFFGAGGGGGSPNAVAWLRA